MRLADENQDHKWIITKKGADLYREWHLGQMRRDAEAFDVFAYNDYNGYGTGEVVENMVPTHHCCCSGHFVDVSS